MTQVHPEINHRLQYKRNTSEYIPKLQYFNTSVYHFTNLIIGTHLQVRTMPSRNSSKVRYFLPDTEHQRQMETIIIRDDPEGLVDDNRWDLA